MYTHYVIRNPKFLTICIFRCIEQFSKASDKSSSGFMKWTTDAEACEALALCNHQPIKDEECTYPYTIKLAFASPNLSAEPIHVGSDKSNEENGRNHTE